MVELLELMGCAVQFFKQSRLGLTPCHRAGSDVTGRALISGSDCGSGWGRGVRRGVAELGKSGSEEGVLGVGAAHGAKRG